MKICYDTENRFFNHGRRERLVKDLRMFSWLIKVNKCQNWRVFLLAASHVLLALFGVGFAIMTSRVVDGAIAGLNANFWKNAVGLAALGTGQIVLHFLNRHLSVDIISGIDIHMKRLLFCNILKKDFSSVNYCPVLFGVFFSKNDTY